MKTLQVAIFFATIVLVLANVPVLRYHENIGIPLGARIRQTEQAINFDGSRITGGSPAPLGAYPYLLFVKFAFLQFIDEIQPISFPSGSLLNNNFVGVWAQASGYGMTGDGAEHAITSNQVQSHVNLRVISNAECREVFRDFVLDSNICTSGADGANVCSSDSGGPLSIRNGNQRVLIGVVSFGSDLGCEARQPAVYARVTSFTSWIQSRL